MPPASAPDPNRVADHATRARLPVPLTRFVGRSRERADLAGLVRQHRLVTATGPGGVGKTRLALAVAEDLVETYPDGVAFVDLVRVTDPADVVAVVADTLGVPDGLGTNRRDALVAAVADRRMVLVLDNCEHLLPGVRALVGDLLTGSTASMLATSRSRLLVPGERVYAVPGLALASGESGASGDDAVRLFVDRTVSNGGTEPTDPLEIDAIRDVCRSLDGMALAIELAAARVPSLGLDGLRLALRDSLAVLDRGYAGDDRHGSLHATIDWSYRLLAEEERRVLRGIAVFAAPFTLAAGAAVLDLADDRLLRVLGHLVDANLVTLRPGLPSRYRVLETIRQFAAEVTDPDDEGAQLRHRHLDWCTGVLDRLLEAAPGDATWGRDVDLVLDEARAALGWLVDTSGQDEEATALAVRIGTLLFHGGHPTEAQQRYHQAAGLTSDPEAQHQWLFLAARTALARHAGSEAVALLEQAAAQAEARGDVERAALDLVHAVTIQHRFIGVMSAAPTTAGSDASLARARELGGGSASVTAAIAVAMATRDDVGRPDVPGALELARAVGDPLLLDAALDQLCAIQVSNGELAAATATTSERLALLRAVPLDPGSAIDHLDSHFMGVQVNLASGRFAVARRHADEIATLPFLREESHVALGRRIEVDVVAGEHDDVLRLSETFLSGWRRAGRPRVNNLASAAAGVAMVHGMAGRTELRGEWLEVAARLLRDPADLSRTDRVWPVTYDALLALHEDDPDRALAVLTVDPDAGLPRQWNPRIWVSWYAAAWAEASALAGLPDAEERLARAARVVQGNDVASAVIERSDALRRDSPGELPALAERLAGLGARYQADRTTSLAASRGVGAATPVGLAALSGRELDVLRLVVAGSTNAQIAAELFISRKTAEHHVSHILTKLGATNRAEAAAMASRQGLGGG